MPSVVTNQATEAALRRALERDGFALSRSRVNGETGVDILAKKGRVKVFIEVMGHKSSPPARSRDFFANFFRAVSRIQDGARRCAIAMPSLAGRGLPARAKHYGMAWTRIGKAFPELEIWLVDIDAREYTRTHWNEWSQG